MRKGFTLIELLIVVIIIGILVATILPNLAGKTQQARIRRAESEIKGTISTALSMYEMDFGRYPEELAMLWNKDLIPDEWLDNPDEYQLRWNGPYIRRVKIKEGRKILDPWGRPYKYECKGQGRDQGKNYKLSSQGPNPDDDSDNIVYDSSKEFEEENY